MCVMYVWNHITVVPKKLLYQYIYIYIYRYIYIGQESNQRTSKLLTYKSYTQRPRIDSIRFTETSLDFIYIYLYIYITIVIAYIYIYIYLCIYTYVFKLTRFCWCDDDDDRYADKTSNIKIWQFRIVIIITVQNKWITKK